jgi:hypothetical protein
VVRDRNDDGDAVLTVKSDRGKYILDNQTEDSRYIDFVVGPGRRALAMHAGRACHLSLPLNDLYPAGVRPVGARRPTAAPAFLAKEPPDTVAG